MTGFTRAEVMQRSACTEFLQGQLTSHTVVHSIKEALRKGEEKHFEILYYRKDGECAHRAIYFRFQNDKLRWYYLYCSYHPDCKRNCSTLFDKKKVQLQWVYQYNARFIVCHRAIWRLLNFSNEQTWVYILSKLSCQILVTANANWAYSQVLMSTAHYKWWNQWIGLCRQNKCTSLGV